MFFKKKKPAPDVLAHELLAFLASTFGADSAIRELTMNQDEKRRFIFSAHVLTMVYLSFLTWSSNGELPEHTLETHLKMIELIDGHNDIRHVGDYIIDPVELGYLPNHLRDRWQVQSDPRFISQRRVPHYMLVESASTMRFARIAADVQKISGGTMDAFQIVNVTGAHLTGQIYYRDSATFAHDYDQHLLFAAWASTLLEGIMEKTEKYT